MHEILSPPAQETGFIRRDGELMVEALSLEAIARSVGTPVYVYSKAMLSATYRDFADAFADLDATICYAIKANSNLAILRALAREGAGADVVSGGELARALAAGIDPRRIVFAGVGKTTDEMRAGLGAGILQFNVESMAELEALDAVGRDLGRPAPVAFRINPDVDALTHAKIATGKSETKFGIEIADAPAAFAMAAGLSGIAPVGLSAHIGSQVSGLEPYRATYRRLAELARGLRAAGYGLSRIDLGGGFSVRYRDEEPPSARDFAALARAEIAPLGLPIIIEPGRRLVAEAGVLLTRILYVKPGLSRRLIIVDAAMNDLIRPTLYGAYHAIEPVKPAEGELRPADIVGPICETGDYFALDRPMPPLEPGRLLAIRAAGAYGAVMASSYNTRAPAPEVLVSGARFAVIRPRRSIEELIAEDHVPAWLS